MRINSDIILGIPLTQCAVVVLKNKYFSEEQLVNDLLFGSENLTLDANANIIPNALIVSFSKSKLIFFLNFIP